MLLVLFSFCCSVSAQPVAKTGNGFLTVNASEPVNLFTPEASTATASVNLASAPLPFYLDTPTASVPFMPMADPLGSTLRIISSLFAVILIAFGLSWFIQKKTGLGGNVFGKVLGILPLDNRHMLYLVDVMGKVLILGVTDSNINLLGEITDKDTLDALRLQNQKPLPGMEKLFAFMRPSNDATSTHDELSASGQRSPAQTQNQRNHDRLRKLNELLVKRDTPPEN